VTEEERGRNGGVEIVNLPPMFLSNPPPKFPFIPKFRWKKNEGAQKKLAQIHRTVRTEKDINRANPNRNIEITSKSSHHSCQTTKTKSFKQAKMNSPKMNPETRLNWAAYQFTSRCFSAFVVGAAAATEP